MRLDGFIFMKVLRNWAFGALEAAPYITYFVFLMVCILVATWITVKVIKRHPEYLNKESRKKVKRLQSINWQLRAALIKTRGERDSHYELVKSIIIHIRRNEKMFVEESDFDIKELLRSTDDEDLFEAKPGRVKKG